MADRESVQLEQAYLLHQRPYRNTSQIIDCLSREHGLVALVAQGSRRSKTGQRAILQPFLPLRVSWLRRSDLGRLTHVELEQRDGELAGQQLLAGFYMNELLLRLLAKGDGNLDVFSCYSRALADLIARIDTARVLRVFELHLLEALGYGLNLSHDAETGDPISAECRYVFEPERGARIDEGAGDGADSYLGKELISLREMSFDDKKNLRAAKRLLSRTLRLYLGERPLKSSTVLRDIVDQGVEL
jgi:DNA repair protein RecO (recombination protein O)